MKFARYTFLIAGVYGLLVLVPQYLIETGAMGEVPPLAQPEFFYGFIGVATAFQLVFLVIATDPKKYRPMILPSIVEKFSFAIAVAALVLAGRVRGQIVIGAAIDAILGVLFIVSWFKIFRKPKPDIESDAVH